ncbi:archaetidylserine decarboxylase [Oceanobacter mangrovi]|uniref:archaetidylserine decarboxylase n=1 Tax=Oceanobacter mangrovi TaxID=2862510 RepID=UPI001C8E0AC1|nr:archaetidylserine decarboxylase [Oceanobacter mangrovi]
MLKDDFFIASQYILPHQLLSRLVGKLAASENRWIKNQLIQRFMDHFGVTLDEAVHQHPQDFKSFNDFFTRELLPDARPLDNGIDSLLSPVDGAVSQLGDIQRGRIFQAKGQEFSLNELLGGDRQRSEPFVGGKFATLYLSPRDYHRVHMPMAGKLKEMIYVPGSLFSVNQVTAERVPGLFARNERLVCIFETEHGPMAMVLVGAMIVAAIETVWAGRITPAERKIKVVDYRDPQPVELDRGAEMGRFCLGSTVVLCFPDGMIDWSSELAAGSSLTMGSRLGSINAMKPAETAVPDKVGQHEPAEADEKDEADSDESADSGEAAE